MSEQAASELKQPADCGEMQMSSGRPTLDYEPRRRATSTRIPRAVGWLVVALGVFLIYHTMTGLSETSQQREIANQMKCGNNLSQIRLAISAYCQANGGSFPPDLQTLMAAGQLTHDVLICPASRDVSEAYVPCSYVYTGSGLTQDGGANCVVAFENPLSHRSSGGNVLFRDGSVAFAPSSQLRLWIDELAAGHNPPAPAAVPAPAATQPAAGRDGGQADDEDRLRSRLLQMQAQGWRAPQSGRAPATGRSPG